MTCVYVWTDSLNNVSKSLGYMHLYVLASIALFIKFDLRMQSVFLRSQVNTYISHLSSETFCV